MDTAIAGTASSQVCTGFHSARSGYPFHRCFYDGIVLLGECSPWLAADAHARTFVGDAYRLGKPVGVVAPSPDQTLATLARLGHDVPPHDDLGIVVDPEPRSADNDFTCTSSKPLPCTGFSTGSRADCGRISAVEGAVLARE